LQNKEVGAVDLIRFLWRSKYVCLAFMILFPLIGKVLFSDKLVLEAINGNIPIGVSRQDRRQGPQNYDFLGEQILYITSQPLPPTLPADTDDLTKKLHFLSARESRNYVNLSFESNTSIKVTDQAKFFGEVIGALNERIRLHNEFIKTTMKDEFPLQTSQIEIALDSILYR
jgi:hypothetical protein